MTNSPFMGQSGPAQKRATAMRKMLIYPVCLVAWLGAFALPGAVAAAGNKPPIVTDDPDAVRSRLENVNRLVHTSSAAKRIKASGDAQAKRLQAEAAGLLKSARKKLDRRDPKGASADLDQATEAMFAAIRGVGTGAEGVSKKKRDFEAKKASVEVLVTALERIAAEKGQSSRFRREASSIRGQVGRAQRQADTGRWDEARAALDAAYEQAKIAVEGLRQGDTLVRSLNFASKEEEYRYELDRNDTHQMLVKVLLEEKTLSSSTQKTVDSLIDDARRLRKRAEREARAGRFEQAVGTLESSTKSLVQAIRRAGVYIPG